MSLKWLIYFTFLIFNLIGILDLMNQFVFAFKKQTYTYSPVFQ